MLRTHCLGYKMAPNKTKCRRFGAVKGPRLSKKGIVKRLFMAQIDILLLFWWDSMPKTILAHSIMGFLENSKIQHVSLLQTAFNIYSTSLVREYETM